MRAPPPTYPDLRTALRAVWDDPLAFGEAMGYRGDEDGRKRFGPVHRLIVERLMGSKRTSTLIPRNHGKSTIISVIYTAWCLLRDPGRRIMVCSASKDLAREIIGEIRDLLWGELEFTIDGEEVNFPLIEAFPYLRPKGRRDSEGPVDYLNIVGKKNIKGPTGREHSLFASSPTTRSTGKHPNMIIVDDPCDLQNSETFDQRQKIIKWFKALNPILKSRSNPLQHIGTCWAPNDLSEVLRHNKAFHQLRLAAWVPENPQTGVADGLGPGPLPGGRWAEKYKGYYPLDPSYMTAEELWEEEQDQEEAGRANFFAAQYLNEPMVAADTIFPDEILLGSVRPTVPPFTGYPELILWDPTGRLTGTKGDANGLVIVQPVPAKVWCAETGEKREALEDDRNIFIVRYSHLVYGGSDDALRVVESLCAERPQVKAVWIEDVGAQATLKPWLEERGKIKGVKVRGQKISNASQPQRLQGLATAMRQGQLILPDEFPGRETLLKQLSEYPKSDYDDLPCALALIGQHRERRGALPDVPGPTLNDADPLSLWTSQVGTPSPRRGLGW